MTNKENILHRKSFELALKIIQLSRTLQEEQKEYILSRQIMRSGTSIGANIKESEHAESRADFIHKLQISLKEANETEYWLQLLLDSGLIHADIHERILPELTEIIKMLISSIKTLKK